MRFTQSAYGCFDMFNGGLNAVKMGLLRRQSRSTLGRSLSSPA